MDFFAKKESDLATRQAFEASVGWRYGLVFGIVLVLFGWGIDAWELASAAAELFWPRLLLASITLIPLSAAAGGWAVRNPRSPAQKFIIWIGCASTTGLIAIHLPFEGTSAVAGLVDPAVRGLAIFPFTAAVQERVALVASFGAAAGLFAGILQNLATAWAWERSTADNRITRDGWMMLLISAPLALGLGALYDGAANAQLRAPLQRTNRVIQVALHTPSDLDPSALETLRALDYLATSQWRSQFSGRFTQHLADFDRKTLREAYVDTEFDNGFIWRCQTKRNGEVLLGCRDLVAEYREWMQQFLRTGAVRCEDCAVRIEPDALAWQLEHRAESSDPSQISVVHHLGGVVVVRADLGADNKVECRFVSAEPVEIRDCEKK